MYKAGIQYNEETCLRLALVQDKVYGKTRLIVRVILTLIPIVIAYFVGFGTTWGAILIALGVLICYSTGFMYERDASKALQGTPEKYRKVEYFFHTDSFSVESGGMEKAVPYGDVYSLATDGIYQYVFINTQQAYMLELKKDRAGKSRKSIEADFEAFLSKKTGKKWKKVRLRRTFSMFIHDRIKQLKYGKQG